MTMMGTDVLADGVVLWRRGGFVEDRWARIGDEDALPPEGAVIVTLARWQDLRRSDAPGAWEVGVALAAGDDVREIAADLPRLALITLDFPKFTDGRSYSAARLLRERYGFAGELRATGEVLLDQIPFMRRCGFDSFAISHEPTRRALADGRLTDVPIYLQPVSERGEVPVGTRPWLRHRA